MDRNLSSSKRRAAYSSTVMGGGRPIGNSRERRNEDGGTHINVKCVIEDVVLS